MKSFHLPELLLLLNIYYLSIKDSCSEKEYFKKNTFRKGPISPFLNFTGLIKLNFKVQGCKDEAFKNYLILRHSLYACNFLKLRVQLTLGAVSLWQQQLFFPDKVTFCEESSSSHYDLISLISVGQVEKLANFRLNIFIKFCFKGKKNICCKK